MENPEIVGLFCGLTLRAFFETLHVTQPDLKARSSYFLCICSYFELVLACVTQDNLSQLVEASRRHTWVTGSNPTELLSSMVMGRERFEELKRFGAFERASLV